MIKRPLNQLDASQPSNDSTHAIQLMSQSTSALSVELVAPSGEAYPKFLVEHIKERWEGVVVDSLNPDICLKVDSALDYAGCDEPSLQVRQFLYIYHESADFDYEVLQLLVQLFDLAGQNQDVWNSLVALDFQRDCGLAREEYLAQLSMMVEDLEFDSMMLVDCAETQLSA